MSKTIVVNLFGVPSSGKSTGSAYVFSQLKMQNINADSDWSKHIDDFFLDK